MVANNNSRDKKLSKAEWWGFAAFGAAIGLGAIDLRLAAVPLTLFLTLCILAPFLPRAGFFFPVVSRGDAEGQRIAITFDDGPDPATTPALLDLLAAYRVPAAFFVTGRRATDYPHLVRAIIDGGHEVGNHSFHHNRYRMFWMPNLLADEIAATQRALAPAGIEPLAFRPPVGITTPAMGKVLAANDLYAVNFSCRALDGGNRRIDRLAARILSRVKPGDIVLLHDTVPKASRGTRRWLAEIETILLGIAEKRLAAVSLSDLIGRPVMHRTK